MSENVILQLAIVVFVVLSTLMGRWMARVERARQAAAQHIERAIDTPTPALTTWSDPTQSSFKAAALPLESAGFAEGTMNPENGEANGNGSGTSVLGHPEGRARVEPGRESASIRRPQAAALGNRPMRVQLRSAFKLLLIISPPKTLEGEANQDVLHTSP